MEIEFDEMAEGDIRPGDLVFVLARQDGGLEQFIATINGTLWCHVGVACGDGMVASARCDTGLLDLTAGGGARLDPLSWYRDELDRQIVVGRVGGAGGGPGETENPRFAARRDAAAQFGRLLTAPEHAHRTRFSFSKTVLAGIACRAADSFPRMTTEAVVELLDAVDVVAAEWEATPASPTFAAAEFVAAAYRLPLTRGALQGPVIVVPDEFPRADREGLGHRLVREQEPGRGDAFARVLDLVERHDAMALRPAAQVFGDWWRRGGSGPPLVVEPESSPHHPEVPGSGQRIGAALMSARTLEHAWWVEKLRIAVP